MISSPASKQIPPNLKFVSPCDKNSSNAEDPVSKRPTPIPITSIDSLDLLYPMIFSLTKIYCHQHLRLGLINIAMPNKAWQV
jgi:hypothetical protein